MFVPSPIPLNALKGVGSGALAALLSASLSLATTIQAHSAEEVGQSVRIKNLVNASLNNRRLAPRDPVFASERIDAGTDSHGEIRLSDNSKVIVGENSSISLDDFVTGTRGFSSGSIKVAKGAFRFITGNSPKGAFTIETPVSTIGARGTIFDVYVSPGLTRVILFQGEIEVCSTTNCIVTSDRCDIVEVRNNQANELDFLRSGDRAQENSLYDLISGQSRFRPGWRAPVFQCEQRAALQRLRGPDNNLREKPGGERDPNGATGRPEPEYDYTPPCGINCS